MRIWFKALLVLLALLILIPVTLLGLLAHPRSPVWVGEWIDQQIDSVHISGVSGHWFRDLRIEHLQIELDQGPIQLDQIELALRPSCLLSYRVCIESLQIDHLRIRLTDSDTQQTPADDTGLPFRYDFPLPLQFDRLQLAEFELQLDSVRIAAEQLSTQGRYGPLGLRLQQPSLATLRIEVDTQANSESAADTGPEPQSQLPAIYAPFYMQLDALALNQLELQIGHQQHSIEQIQLSADWRAYQLSVQQLHATYTGLTGTLAGRLNFSRAWPLSLQGSLELPRASLPITRWQVAAEGDFNEIEADLRSLEPSIASGKLRLNNLLEEPQFHLSASANTLSLLDNRVTLAQTRINAQGQFDHYAADISTRLSGPQLPEAELSGHLSGDAESLQLSPLTVQLLGGQLDIEANLSWRQQLQAQWSLVGQQLDLSTLSADYPMPTALSLVHSGQLQFDSTEQWQLDIFDLDADAVVAQVPWQLQAQGQLSPQQAQLKQLHLTHPDGALTLHGSIADHWQLDGSFDLHALPVADLNLDTARGNVTVRGARQTPLISAEVGLEQLNYAAVTLEAARLNGFLRWQADPEFDLSVDIDNAELADSRWQQLKLSATGSLQQHQLKLSATSEQLASHWTLDGGHSAAALWQGQLAAWQIALQHGDSNGDPHWQLAAPVGLVITDAAQLQLRQALCMRSAEASICAHKLALTEEAFELQLTVEQLALARIEPFIDHAFSLDGNVDGQLNLRRTDKGPLQGEATLNLSAGGIAAHWAEQSARQHWQHGSLTMTLAQQWQLQGDLQLDPQASISTELVLSDPLGQQQLDGHLQLTQVPLDALDPWLGDYLDLKGLLNANLALSGDRQNPGVDGTIQISQISMEHASGVQLDSGDVQLQFSGQQGALSGWLGSGEARMQLDGTAQWQAQTPALQLTARSERWPLLLPDLGQLALQPQIKLDYADHRLQLRGDVNLLEGDLRIDSLPESAVAVSDDEVIIEHQADVGQRTPLLIDSELNIHLGQRLSLNAFGLRGRLTGDLLLRQLNQDLSLFGSVQIRDGTFNSFGQALNMRRAILSFNGPPSLPIIDAEAIRDPDKTNDNVIAGVRITGAASKPDISLFSEPRGMAQQRIISYLVRGSDLESSGNADDSALTMAMIGLGLTGTGQVVGQIGESLGVNDLTLDSKGSGDQAQVVVSANILPRLNVRYGRGVFQPISELTLRYKLVRNLYVEAVSGINQAFDLVYRIDF